VTADVFTISARDVVGPAARFAEFAKFEIERVADGEPGAKLERLEAVLAGAYACTEALVDAGFDTPAEEWANVTKQIERAIAEVPCGIEVAS